jgi:hypothetical protein
MQKPPLFRKVNTTARWVHHRFGGDFSNERNSKSSQRSEATRQGMSGKKKRGLDYTPLFKFLLSKVGGQWNEVHSEAVSRLDKQDPIFWMVALRPEEEKDYIRIGEASFFSGLRVDSAGALRFVNASIAAPSLAPQCKCCTHTFNGLIFTQSFDESLRLSTSALRLA